MGIWGRGQIWELLLDGSEGWGVVVVVVVVRRGVTHVVGDAIKFIY